MCIGPAEYFHFRGSAAHGPARALQRAGLTKQDPRSVSVGQVVASKTHARVTRCGSDECGPVVKTKIAGLRSTDPLNVDERAGRMWSDPRQPGILVEPFAYRGVTAWRVAPRVAPARSARA